MPASLSSNVLVPGNKSACPGLSQTVRSREIFDERAKVILAGSMLTVISSVTLAQQTLTGTVNNQQDQWDCRNVRSRKVALSERIPAALPSNSKCKPACWIHCMPATRVLLPSVKQAGRRQSRNFRSNSSQKLGRTIPAAGVRTLAPTTPFAYRRPHAIEIGDMGGGLFAPLPDRGRVRRGATARRGGGGCCVRQGGHAGRQCHAVCACAPDGL